ncbi:MAG TPA: hypothetical protein PLP17_10350 [Oligoflexia bacterium]|nr:hypothetical protein [Oligoflexia bacterium]
MIKRHSAGQKLSLFAPADIFRHLIKALLVHKKMPAPNSEAGNSLQIQDKFRGQELSLIPTILHKLGIELARMKQVDGALHAPFSGAGKPSDKFLEYPSANNQRENLLVVVSK